MRLEKKMQKVRKGDKKGGGAEFEPKAWETWL